MVDVDFLRKKLMRKAREEVSEKSSERDLQAIKSINLIEDLDMIMNLLSEQIREWYGLHFPELNEIVKDNDNYLKLVANIGNKKDYNQENILEGYNNSEKAKKIFEASKKSIGAEFQENDISQVQNLAKTALAINNQRKDLNNYLENLMSTEYPNFTKIAGPLLGAKLLSKSGSFKKLAFSPASTIQVLGAEKALFQHLKKGTKGPKHGLLYQHPLVKEVRPWNKGKISRSLAAKLSLAAKEDYFGNTDISEELENDLNSRVKSIKSIKPKPKKKKR